MSWLGRALLVFSIALILSCAVVAFSLRRLPREMSQSHLGGLLALIVLPSAVASTVRRREQRLKELCSQGQHTSASPALALFLLEIVSNGTFLEKERAVAWCKARMAEFDYTNDVAFFLKTAASMSMTCMEPVYIWDRTMEKEGLSLFFTTIFMRLGLPVPELKEIYPEDWLSSSELNHNFIAEGRWRSIGILRWLSCMISTYMCRLRHDQKFGGVKIKALGLVLTVVHRLPELNLRGLLALICWLDPLTFKAVQNLFVEVFPPDSVLGATPTSRAGAVTAQWLRGAPHPYGQGSSLIQDVLASCLHNETNPASVLFYLPREIATFARTTLKVACLRWRVEQERARLFTARAGSPPTVFPRHVGMIMDGNRRWARRHGLPITDGHEAGTRAGHELIKWWVRLEKDLNNTNGDVKPAKPPVLSLFTFSLDNFKRAPTEVTELLQLIAWHLEDIAYTPFIHLHRIRVRVSHADGAREKFPPALCDAIDLVERVTASYGGGARFELLYLVGYDGRTEVLDAVREVVRTGEEITSSNISLRTSCGRLDLPPVDLIVRSSGIMRTSGFFLWDTRAAEMFFIDCFWPDLSELDWLRSCVRFGQRESLGGT